MQWKKEGKGEEGVKRRELTEEEKVLQKINKKNSIADNKIMLKRGDRDCALIAIQVTVLQMLVIIMCILGWKLRTFEIRL